MGKRADRDDDVYAAVLVPSKWGKPPHVRRNKIVYLTKRPSRCTTCGASRVVAHDVIATKYYGPVRTFRCPKCREYFYVYTNNVLRLLAAAGVREHWNDLVQIMGLVALGLPLAQIENLKRRKQETIWARLQRCRASIPLWREIASALRTQWKFRQDEVGRLNSFTPSAKDHDSPFHVAFVLTPTPNIACDAGLRKQRECVRRKVEQILQRQIAYTGAGELHLADGDVMQIGWVRAIRAARSDILTELEEFLSEIASHVRQPNEESQEIARAEARAKGATLAMSLTALCEGFYRKIPLPVFLDEIKQIAKSLEVFG
jgi:hypothetical protein